MGQPRRNKPISVHPTLYGQLEVDWDNEYQNEYYCPSCKKGKITKCYYRHEFDFKLNLQCNDCQKRTCLACRVPIYIARYCPKMECPNPLCIEIGNNGQKGWIYQKNIKNCQYQCYFCKTVFKLNTKARHSWINSQTEEQLLPFIFDEDIWDLRHFDNKPYVRTVNFKGIYPGWYRQEVKGYLYYLLKSKGSYSCSIIKHKIIALRQFGKIIVISNLRNKFEINRNLITLFLDNCKNNKNRTINRKVSSLRDFFDWLGLETSYLIRSRDFLKANKNDTDWLDTITRTAIKKNLGKIPAPIARQYLIQTYIAARPVDVCQMAFDCLVEDNGKWYVKFFQQKTNRWHKILASRKIRKVIEQQQQWIRKTFSEDYSSLFCHFWNIRVAAYPSFSNIKPLPRPPKTDVGSNPMVRIIRMLIEKENIIDANGQKPHFTGKITRHSRLQEVRIKYGMEAAQLYADHKSSNTIFKHYAPLWLSVREAFRL